MTALLVVLGGALGAPLRYLLDLTVQAWHRTRFPWGTFAVNAAGSFVLGAVAAGAGPGAAAFLGTGVCGALTTWSTFGYETVRLAEEGAWRAAAGNTALSLGVGLAAAALGWQLGAGV